VEFDYLFHDSTEQEKSYIGEQAVNTDLAMQLQGHSKETAVLYLPQKPYVARLAWTFKGDTRVYPDYKHIKGDLTLGICIPCFYIGLASAVLLLHQLSFYPMTPAAIGAYFLIILLGISLPLLFIERVIKKAFLE
jgi:hypothetical protein